jgi:hypothetical protein
MQQLRTGVLQEAFRMVRTPPPLTSSSIAIQHLQPPGGLTRGVSFSPRMRITRPA